MWQVFRISATDPNKEWEIWTVVGNKEKAYDFVQDRLKSYIMETLEGKEQKRALTRLRSGYMGDGYGSNDDIEPIELGGYFLGQHMVLDDCVGYNQWSSYSDHYYLKEMTFDNNGVSNTVIFEH